MRDSITLYRNQLDAILALDPEDAKETLRVIKEYGMDGREPETKNGAAMAMFYAFRLVIDANNKKARPRSKQEQSGDIPEQTEYIPEQTGYFQGQSGDIPEQTGDKPALNVKDINIKENLSPKGESQKKSAQRFTPPTLQDVAAYVTEKGYNVDPERFVDYYAARGWKIKGDSMKDWKAAVRNWHRTQRRDEPPKRPQGQEKTAQANRFINYQQRETDLDAILLAQQREYYNA